MRASSTKATLAKNFAMMICQSESGLVSSISMVPVLLSASFVSIGVFCSSVTNNQILAFILSVFLCGFIYIGFEFIYSLSLFGSIDLFIQRLGMAAHYSSISRGVVDTRDILYFVSVMALFLSMTKLVLASRKW